MSKKEKKVEKNNPGDKYSERESVAEFFLATDTSLGQALCEFWVGGREPRTLWFMIKEESTQLQPNSELSPFLDYNFLCGKKGTTPKSCRPKILGRLTSYPLFLVIMSQALPHPPKTHREPVPQHTTEATRRKEFDIRKGFQPGSERGAHEKACQWYLRWSPQTSGVG